MNEMKMLNDSLKMDIGNKEREIRRLNKDVQQYEQTIMSLRNELSGKKYHTPPLDVTSKTDAEVTAEICCRRTRECDDVEPVKECGKGEESIHQNCSHHQQHQKVNSDIYALRQENVALHQELQVMQRVWAAVDEQCRVADVRAKFKDEVIHEMRRQLRQAKAKLKELSEAKVTQKDREIHKPSQSYDSLTIACVQQQPRRKHRARPDVDLNNWECHSPTYESGDEMSSKFGMRTSTPNTSPRNDRLDVTEDSDMSVIERSPSPPLLISDPSISEAEECIVKVTPSDCACTRPRSLAEITSRVKRRNSLVNIEIEEQSEHDASNILESVRACSVDSAASDATRIRTLEDKLHATMQILKNKEETVRVQAESLALAEARIAKLSSKASARLHQAQQTNLFNNRNACVGNQVDMADVSITAQIQEERVVNTLRDNLSVIEELYRECFYETAKQEELISLLRRSYLDMRLEKKQSEQFRLHSQKNSLQRCQDIAMEVEHLKSEITNFLNNSTNNDSGVWVGGHEEGSELSEDLRGIAQQLHRLRAVLSADCICGLEEENMKLKQKNETMEIEISKLRQRIGNLEDALADKENMDQRYRKQLNEKEQELKTARQQLSVVEEGSREQAAARDALSTQLKQMEVLLNDKSVEVFTTQQQCESLERTVRQLREEVQQADLVARENNQIRLEVSELSAQVSQWRDQLADSRRRLHILEEELRRAREHCTHLALHYREKSATAHSLQSQLAEAQRRGAALCGEARRAVCAVRRWLRAQRDKHKKQEETIKEQQRIIQTLQTQQTTEQSENEPCCSRYLNLEPRVSETTLYAREHASNTSSKYQESRKSNRVRARETPCSKCSRSSETDSPSPPIPPKRLLRKKDICGDRRCQWPDTHEASSQRPQRSDAQVDTRASSLSDTLSREVSPPEELLERVERAHEALVEAQRRWSKHSAPGDLRRK